MSGARVLVVDDELSLAETLADGLSDRGFVAVALGCPLEALTRLDAERFDVIVTDLRMPRVDGLDLVSAARRQAPKVPVIVMTAYGALDGARDAAMRGAFAYLTKPFPLDELAREITRAVKSPHARE